MKRTNFWFRFNSTFLFILVGILCYHDASGQTFCDSPVADIDDNFTTTRSLVVSGTIGTISDLIIYVDIQHTWIGDLTIWVTSPNGTVVTLYDRNCGGTTTRYEDILTYFDDAGLALACPPVGAGFTIPVGSLAAFDGQSMNGTWTISIQDHEALDFGTLYVWCLYATLDLDEYCPLSVSPELAIQDNQTISSQIEVSNTYGTISDLNVRVGITHTYIGDLRIWLVSPAFTSVDLFNHSCSSADNIATYFDDQALPPLACPPINGVLSVPASPLNAFNGQQLNGTWTLYVQDNAGGDVGYLDGWCLQPTIESGCSDYSSTPISAIEDLQTVSDQITVSGTSGIITDLDVRVGVTHTWIGDLTIRVESPSGTVADLYNRDCGYDTLRYRNIETYFNDEGASLNCPPVNGVLTIPEDPLNAFDGESLNGTWTIYVHDSVLYDAGLLNGWCLIPTFGECINNGQCDDGSPCTNDFCQNNICHHDCGLHFSNVVFNSNTIVGCDDGSVSATVNFGNCTNWNAKLVIGNTIHRNWLSSQGASVHWENIPAGNYLMIASDGNGCADTTNIPIGTGIPCNLEFENPDSSHTTPTSVQGCNDGSINTSIEAFVCGGNLAWTATLFNDLNNVVNSFSPTTGSAILWNNLPSGDYRIVATANSSICANELNITVPAGAPCRVEVQNVQKTVVDCNSNSITADISVLTCNNTWYAYLYVSDYSTFIKSWDYNQGASISWSGIPLGNYHLFATNLGSCSDTVDVILSCSDNDPCTVDACAGGCFHSFKCEDNNPCTEDFCQAGGICQNNQVICNDGNLCTNDACVNGGCVNTPINCADNNGCTVDQCFNGNCTHTTMVCNDANACTNDACQNGICNYIPTCILDDNDPCTDDHCVNRTCLHPSKNCNDNNSCTDDDCQGGTCINNPTCTLNDGNPCTKDQCLNGICAHIDTCSAGTCTNNPGICNDSNLCTTDTCISGGCVYPPKSCDDGSSCTDDICNNGNCLHNPICIVDDGDPCTTDGCVNGDCLHAPKNCNDNNECTDDYCQNGNCIHQQLCIIDDNDPCTNDICLSGQCIHQDIFCNDGLLCTTDSCHNGICKFEPIACDDGNPCTTDSCRNGNCIFSPDPNCTDPCDLIVCDDSDPCTNDSCSNGSCLFQSVNCDDSDICTDDSCTNGTCFHTPLGNCNLSISGAILSETGTPVTGVTVNLTGTGSQNLVTSSDGLFSFNVNQGDNCTIIPSKSNDSITSNGITTLDIILLQRQILAILPLNSPYKKIAADVNNSQTITTLDIVFIRRVILQTSPTFPNGKLWTFVSSDYDFNDTLPPFPFDNFRSYPNINSTQTGQNFVAIKLGDVNNSWNSTIAKQEAAGEVKMIMNDHSVQPDEIVIVPVRVKDFNHITGFQFTLSWDAQVLKFLDVNNQALKSYFSLNAVADGLLTVSWYDDQTKDITLHDNEAVFDLKLKAIGPAGTSSIVAIGSELTHSEAYNQHLDLLNITAENGMVKVGNTEFPGSGSLCCKLKAVPNPFSNSTNIIFSVPSDGNVSIVIYDLLGKEVRHFKNYFKAGEHSVEWAGDNDTGGEISKGLYQVRMIAGDESSGVKVVLVK